MSRRTSGGVTAEIASVFRSAMENAGLQFSVECQLIAEMVYVDRDMWEKVVSNLLSNAFKFTFDGSVVVTVQAKDGAAQLQVRDTGVGIPEEHRERVFERFHRVEETHARTFEGTGIGLAPRLRNWSDFMAATSTRQARLVRAVHLR